MQKDIGEQLYKWAKDLFPINRSLTGDGVRETLSYLKDIVSELEIKSIPSGTQVFDWEIPMEWNVKDAFIITPEGKKIANFKENNLHLVGYSIPIKKKMTLDELMPHLYTLKDMPTAIPYVTSYYNRDWGFCLSYNEKTSLKPGIYEVVIDSTLKKGELNYGEILIKGREKKEILLSTYICHPSMANNELSGPVVTIKLAELLLKKQIQQNLKYSYRIVFVPETIGSIAYIKKNIKTLKQYVLGGFVITCVGDNNNYSLLKSKFENTIIDRVGLHVLKYHTNNNFKEYGFLKRGSDERQYSSVGVDIPMISLMRSKYGEYKEYHTSLDNLDFISPEGLYGGYEIHRKAIEILENNEVYKIKTICEPQLGKRGLYPLRSTKDTQREVELMMNIVGYADGTLDLLTLCDKINADFFQCTEIIKNLIRSDLMTKSKNK